MTALSVVPIALALIALALIDGACSGIRAGLGRTGLIRHQRIDRPGFVEGSVLALVLLIPPATIVWVDFAAHAPAPDPDYLRAGRAILRILLPFAVVVLVALGTYAVLNWQRKYLAMAVILGPCTLARPYVACGAGIAGALAGGRVELTLAVALATVGLLIIEPTLGLRWRRRRTTWTP